MGSINVIAGKIAGTTVMKTNVMTLLIVEAEAMTMTRAMRTQVPKSRRRMKNAPNSNSFVIMKSACLNHGPVMGMMTVETIVMKPQVVQNEFMESFLDAPQTTHGEKSIHL